MSTPRPLRLPQLARLLTLALTLLLTVGLFAPRSQAAPAAAPSPGDATATRPAPTAPAPPPAIGASPAQAAAEAADGRSALPPRQPAPLALESADPAASGRSAAKALGSGAAGAGAAAACNVGDFTGRTGGALVQQIKSVDLDCISSLFQIGRGDAAAAFRESQMVTVAYAVRDAAGGYRGTNDSSITQLMYYLQAGYFVQFYNADVVGPYGAALKTATRSALDAFFANPHSRDVSYDNSGPLGRATTLIDSAQDSARYLPVVKQLLAAYDSATWNPANMAYALNPVFTALFRGHQEADFLPAVQADPSVLDALYTFAVRNNDQLGGSYGNLVFNAVTEMTRFMQYQSFVPRIRPWAQTLAAQSSPADRTRYQRAAVALAVRFYDTANCASYGTCDDAARFKAANLPVSYTCSPSITILAQALDTTQLGTACTSLTGQDAFFHTVARDNGPVRDDNNRTIEVVVFHSSFDYQVLAAVIYAINTNNGGMYLEGDPAKAGNQPRFVAYEAEWARPSFEIWNLNHEYTHFLDGRFDMYGDFDAGMSTPTVWWVEGFAEYVSYAYRKVVNDGAIAAAARHTYKLSDLFDTGYGDQDRVYRWGYLAVRYMLEQHRSDLDAVLAEYRTGDWAGARTLLKTTIGTRYDADFDAWLTRCASGACAGGTPTQPQLPECVGTDVRKLDANCARSNIAATTGNYAHFYLLVPAGTKQVRITTSGGTGNGDLYYNPSGWAYTNAYATRSAGPDNAETLTVTDPPAGYVYFSLYAQQGFGGVSVTSEL
ncbi:M9 family metallopeptidase [Kitasatospora sp. NPDC004745]|uniref:M9 family metallopeptidase n=1 Tax=Kitasatospora sp. NPDC004745 TaxID=3364019 RepID=UPI00367C4727